MLPPHLPLTPASTAPHTPGTRTPMPMTIMAPPPMSSVHVRRVTLTSKKNWWLVETDDDDENRAADSFSSSEETAVAPTSQPYADIDPGSPSPSPPSTSAVFRPPTRHPSVIFSFPTPSSYSAPPNPTSNLAPTAYGSTSELFKCIVKKPEVVQFEINGEMQSNASDVTTQFLAELRVYTTVTRHWNIVAFLGCLEGVGMVLEHVDGRTLLEVVRSRPEITKEKKIQFYNQLLDGLAHLHSFGLSHGDLSLLNVYVTWSSDTIKLLDFGRSVAMDSFFEPPSAMPEDPFSYLGHTESGKFQPFATHKRRRVEQIHLGTRPFTAPEIIRGECTDAILADAYSFGVILVCIDQCVLVDCDPMEQKKDVIPAHFLENCPTFGDKILHYLQKWTERRRVSKEDQISTRPSWWDED